jgi:membrane protein YqaA with SNARE-associated domain
VVSSVGSHRRGRSAFRNSNRKSTWARLRLAVASRAAIARAWTTSCFEGAVALDRNARYETAIAVLRSLGGAALLVAIISFAGWAFRDELTRFGQRFVTRFGFAGIAAGAFLADSLHFPIPPQFYLLTGIAGGRPAAAVLAAVLVGSELGGLSAFALARAVGGSALIARRLESTRRLIDDLLARRGYIGLAAATLLPLSFCLLCMASGAMRLPYRAYGVLAVMRVPRILLSYVVVVLAWRGG